MGDIQEADWLKNLKARMALEKELSRLVESGPESTSLTPGQLQEVVHCLIIENQRMRVRIEHLENERKMCGKKL